MSATNKINSTDVLELDARYENVRKQSKPDLGAKVTYWVKDKVGNDAGSISFSDFGMLVYFDNFPCPKKYFRSELPIRTFEELESDLKRCGLELRSND